MDESYGPVPRKEEVGEGWLTLGLWNFTGERKRWIGAWPL